MAMKGKPKTAKPSGLPAARRSKAKRTGSPANKAKSPANKARPVARKTRGAAPPAASPAPAASSPAQASPLPAAKVPPGAKNPPGALRTLYVISDSTGNLPQHMLTAFLTQFPPGTFQLAPRPFARTAERIDRLLEEIAARPGIVFHAVIAPELKERVRRRCADLGLPSCDLTGRFVEFLASASGVSPRADVQRLHDVDEAYEKRMDAIDFTLQHDDGLGLETLHEADIVLTGVSRTSKTPTSIYLAQQGYHVANVSLAIQVEPPRQLLGLREPKVVGLVIDPRRLAEIRTQRQHDWRMTTTDYNALEAVEREVNWSRRLFARQGWPVINVTNYAVEETAARVLELLRLGR